MGEFKGESRAHREKDTLPSPEWGLKRKRRRLSKKRKKIAISKTRMGDRAVHLIDLLGAYRGRTGAGFRKKRKNYAAGEATNSPCASPERGDFLAAESERERKEKKESTWLGEGRNTAP